jgi:hypothetical protein
MTPAQLSLVKSHELDVHRIREERPSAEQAEAAVRTLLAYAGDDPAREGLLDTPSRVVRSYDEFFGGYLMDPVEVLERTFEETEGDDEMVLLKDTWRRSRVVRTSPICREIASSASASWPAWLRFTHVGCKSRKR